VTRKQVVKRLEDAGIYYDKLVAKKDGTFEFRNGYFYHHREFDASNLAKAQAAFPTATVTQSDHFAAWPNESWIATIIAGAE
jgi:hypothetical protein